ncbi:MAG TPA: hypothetical protein VKA89_06440 [Solirubrobacterales bacterium]|nr:hypothetical protein [Solirubrobacterales bacterium]
MAGDLLGQALVEARVVAYARQLVLVVQPMERLPARREPALEVGGDHPDDEEGRCLEHGDHQSLAAGVVAEKTGTKRPAEIRDRWRMTSRGRPMTSATNRATKT